MIFLGIKLSKDKKYPKFHFLFLFSRLKSSPRVWGWKGPAQALLPQILLELRMLIQGWGFPKASKNLDSFSFLFFLPNLELGLFLLPDKELVWVFPFCLSQSKVNKTNFLLLCHQVKYLSFFGGEF